MKNTSTKYSIHEDMLVVLILNFHRVNYFTCIREAIHDFQVLEQRREGQLDNLQI